MRFGHMHRVGQEVAAFGGGRDRIIAELVDRTVQGANLPAQNLGDHLRAQTDAQKRQIRCHHAL